jgi:hypothetical protein
LGKLTVLGKERDEEVEIDKKNKLAQIKGIWRDFFNEKIFFKSTITAGIPAFSLLVLRAILPCIVFCYEYSTYVIKNIFISF